MPAPIDPSNFHVYLEAFADGELDAERSLLVVRYLCDHPAFVSELTALQRLKRTSDRAVRQRTPAVPDELRQRVAALLEAPTQPAGLAAKSTPPRGPLRIGRWLSAAAAVAVVGSLGYFAGRLTAPRSDGPHVGASNNSSAFGPVIPVALETSMLKIHVDCSRFPLHHTAPIPQELGTLRESLRQDLASDAAHPDLTRLGFRLVGAGPCAKPLEDTVHFLYVAIDPEQRETLSIFAQLATERLTLEVGKLYLITSADAPHPALAWRSRRITYFLVGDHPRTVNAAQKSLASSLKS
jgi:hypothetical protein